MLTGVGRHVDLPDGFIDVAAADPTIADVSPLSDQSLYVFGRNPGVTNIALLGEGGLVISQCPIVVEDATAYFAKNGIDDAMLCIGDDGRPARLRPGQSETLSFSAGMLAEVAVANIKIAEAKPLSQVVARIEGLAPGITNIIALANRGRLIKECLIVVE